MIIGLPCHAKASEEGNEYRCTSTLLNLFHLPNVCCLTNKDKIKKPDSLWLPGFFYVRFVR